MIPLLTGVIAYAVAGILSMIYPRHKFLFGLLGWFGAVAGLVKGTLLYQNQGALITNLGRWGILGIEIKLDQTTLLFATLIVILNLFTLLYLGKEKTGTFYVLYNLLLATSFSLAFSNDLFNIYVSIELLSLISILLIGYDRRPQQIYAGIKYLVASSLAMSLYLIGLGFVYSTGGHLGINKLIGSLEGANPLSLYVGLGLMITGLAVKGGIFLFSMWLPDAYLYSGTIVSTLLAGIATKAGLIGIIRISVLINLNQLLLGLGAITGILGAMLAITSRRAKKILAFSSISQVGYILIGAGLGTPAGILAASLHIFFHGLFKGLLFFSVGHAGIGEVDLYRDEITSIPFSSKLGLIVGSLSLMAIPPFNGYFSKALLLEGAGHGWIWWTILTIGFGTVIYLLELNRALLFSPTTNFKLSDSPLIGFTFTVSLSAFVAWIILGSKEMVNLLIPHHLTVAFTLLPAGALVLFALNKKIQEFETPLFPFTLDNALTSLLTGFLFVVLALFLV